MESNKQRVETVRLTPYQFETTRETINTAVRLPQEKQLGPMDFWKADCGQELTVYRRLLYRHESV